MRNPPQSARGFHCFAPSLREIRNRPAPRHGCRPRRCAPSLVGCRPHVHCACSSPAAAWPAWRPCSALQALAGDRVAIELLAPGRHFTYRPLAVAEPFRRRRRASACRSRRSPPTAACGCTATRSRRCCPTSGAVETQDGARLDYDALVLALGARARRGRPGRADLPRPAGRRARRGARRAAARGARRAGVVPSSSPVGTTWALPLYELALQTAAAVRGSRAARGADARHAPRRRRSPPSARRPSAAVGGLLARARARPAHLRGGAGGSPTAASGWGSATRSRSTRVIALPRLLGPRLRGVPSDPLGFVPVDEFTRVRGLDGVHAVGDVAAHAVKQGGLAAQQAAVAAAVIAARGGRRRHGRRRTARAAADAGRRWTCAAPPPRRRPPTSPRQRRAPPRRSRRA